MANEILINLVLAGVEAFEKRLAGLGSNVRAAVEGFNKGITEGLQGKLPDAELNAFTKELQDNLGSVDGKADKTGSKLKEAASKGEEAFRQTSRGVLELASSLEGLSATGAISGIEGLAGGLASVSGSLGPIILAITALAAAFAGLRIAADVATDIFAHNTIELNTLAGAAGITATEMAQIKLAMAEGGVSTEQLGMVVRTTSIRIQQEWHAIQNSIRDAAGTAATDIRHIADAHRALQDAMREQEAGPRRVEQATLARDAAARGIEEAELGTKSAAIAVEDALIGQVNAQERVREATRGVAAAQLEAKLAVLQTADAHLAVERAVRGVADAQNAVLDAQHAQRTAAESLRSAELSYAEAQYNYNVKHGLQSRDRGFEKQLQEEKEQEVVNSARDRYLAAKNAKRIADENLAASYSAAPEAQRKLEEAKIAEKLQKEKSDPAATADKLLLAETNLLSAVTAREKADTAVDQSKLNFPTSFDKVKLASDSLADSLDNLKKVIGEVGAAPDKTAAAQQAEIDAKNQAREDALKDVKQVEKSLYATPSERERDKDERGNGELLNLRDVSQQTLSQAVIARGGGDFTGTMKAMFEAFAANKGNAPLEQSLVKSFGGRGTPEQMNSLIATLEKGFPAFQKIMERPDIKKLAEEKGSPEAYEKALGVIRDEQKTKNVADNTTDKVGGDNVPQFTQDLNALQAVFKEITPKIESATTALSSFGGVIDKIKGFAEWAGFVKSTPTVPPALTSGPDQHLGANPGQVYVPPKPPTEYFPGANMAQNVGLWMHKQLSGDEFKPKDHTQESTGTLDLLKYVAQKLENVTSYFFSNTGKTQQPSVGRASGGHIRGPGSSTSDSIPALLSDGEYVVNAAAVKHWGVGALDAINGAGRFANGGLAAINHFTEGNVSPSLRIINSISRFADGGVVENHNTNVGQSLRIINSIRHLADGGLVNNNPISNIFNAIKNISHFADGGLTGSGMGIHADLGSLEGFQNNYFKNFGGVFSEALIKIKELMALIGNSAATISKAGPMGFTHARGGLIQSPPRFAMGGLVSMLGTPRFAMGGLATAGMSPTSHHMLDIRTDAGSFSASVSKDTMSELSRSAMRTKLTSTGIKPSWIR